MKENKSKKKKTVTVDQKKSFIADLPTQQFWRSEQLLTLGLRLNELMLALDAIEQFTNDIILISKDRVPNKPEILTEVLEVCEQFNINTLEECFAFVTLMLSHKIASKDSLLALCESCFVLGIFYEKELPSIRQNELYKFDVFENLLTNKSNEAIGYWTKKLNEKQSSKKGGEKEKICQPILKALTQYLENHPRLARMSANHIAKEFTEKIKYEPLTIKFNHSEWEISYHEPDKLIFADPDTNYNKKNKITSRGIVALRKTYVSKAKEEIKNKNKK